MEVMGWEMPRLEAKEEAARVEGEEDRKVAREGVEMKATIAGGVEKRQSGRMEVAVRCKGTQFDIQCICL